MKKTGKIVTHPLLIIASFCGIIISGEAMGGFYLLYILLGLPHLVFHAVTGIIGIGCLLVSYYSQGIKRSVLNIAGALCMIASLVYFFIQPHGDYNYGSFYQFLPLLTMIIFSILLSIFIISNLITLFQKINKENGHSIV